MNPYREAILARDNSKCVYCGCKATAVDHIVPVKRGGPNRLWNMAAVCPSCNSRKSTKHWRMWYCQEYGHNPDKEILIEDRLRYPEFDDAIDERATSTILRIMTSIRILRKNCHMARTIERDEHMRNAVVDRFGSTEAFFGDPDFYNEFTQTGIAFVEIPPPWQYEVIGSYNGLESGFPVCYDTSERDIERVHKVFLGYAQAKDHIQIFGIPKLKMNIRYFDEMNHMFFEARRIILDYTNRVNNAMEKW